MKDRVIIVAILTGLWASQAIAEWKESQLIRQIDTNKADLIALSLSQYFPDLQNYLSAEEMVTPGDVQILSLKGNLREYTWRSAEGCPDTGIKKAHFSDANASFVKNGQTWHVSVRPNLNNKSCSSKNLPAYLIKKVRLK